MYTTRSGHVWLLKRAERLSSPPAIWAKIASQPTLPKIDVFAWRACHDGLPTFGNHTSRTKGLHCRMYLPVETFRNMFGMVSKPRRWNGLKLRRQQ
ncbi:hypothetical protein V6N11_070873 [Hibiscus sabdariffa]